MAPEEFRVRVQGFGIVELAISGEIAVDAAGLTESLGDPADCFIAATGRRHDAKVMTADARLLASDVIETIDARR